MSSNLFLQKGFGATFACGSFRPMKAADCSVAGSKTTLQKRISLKQNLRKYSDHRENSDDRQTFQNSLGAGT